MAKGFSDIKPKTGNNKPRLDEQVELFNLPNKKWVTLRFTNTDVLPNALHWIDIIGSRSKEKVTLAKNCVGFNMETEDHDPDNCPYCEIGNRISVTYYANAIVRSIQEEEPRKKVEPSSKEKKTGFIEKDSETWTPVRVVRIPASLAQKIQSLKDLNVHKDSKGNKKTYDVSDPKYGADVNIKFDKDASGTDKYQVQLSDKVALNEDEQAYLVWNLNPSLIHVENYDDAKRELKRMDMIDKDGNHISFDDDDDEIEKPKKKSKTSPSAAKGKSKAPIEDDEDDEDDIDLDDEDDDDDVEDVKPKSKAKSKPKNKDDDDEDEEESDDDDDSDEDSDDEDLDDEDDEEEEKPKAKGKKPVAKTPAKPAAKGKKPVDDDEGDFDLDEDSDDDDEEDDEEEEKPKAKGKTPAKPAAKGKKPVDDDEDDDEDDFDLDDEAEEVPVKGKKPVAKTPAKPAAKGKKPVDDEDDEEEEKPKAKGKKPVAKTPAKPAAKGKKPVDDDEDDDEDDFDLDD